MKPPTYICTCKGVLHVVNAYTEGGAVRYVADFHRVHRSEVEVTGPLKSTLGVAHSRSFENEE